jgi:formylglycine-generating enzyme required for sulfatase activity
VPVVLHARAAKDHNDPLDAIEARHPGCRHAAQAALKQQRLVLMLDGVDEVVGERADVKLAIERWTPKLGDTRVLLAGRPHGSVEVPGYEKVVLCGLEPAQQHALLVGLGLSAEVAAHTLTTMRDDGARMHHLTFNPLILTLAAFVVKNQGTMPRSRAALYEEVIRLRFEGRYSQRPTIKHKMEKRRLLEDVMLAMVAVEDWTDDALATAIEGAPDWAKLSARCDGVDDFLDEIARETGLLRKAGGRWEPPHRTLREYLAACALYRRGFKDTDLAAAEADEGRWAEVLALLAAKLGANAGELVTRLQARGKPAEPLMWKVLADAEGLSADEVVRAVGLTGGRDAWEARMQTLAGLPELLGGRLDLVVEVAERLGREIEHGAEIWQLREVVREVAEGAAGTVGPGGSEDAIRARARRLVDTILFLHRARGRSARDEVAATMVWCRVPAGRSWIGAHPDDSASFDEEKPGRWVAVTADIELGRDPVTNRLYERFDPGHVAERGTSAAQADAADHPVVFVSWFEAAAFAAWLGARLPTEVEWEHACRAGTTSAYWSGNSEPDLAKVGWYGENSGGRTHAVGDVPTKLAHPFGLRHLHGNVWEWTDSWWTANHAALPDRHDPAPPPDRPPAVRRVVRGGAWWFDPQFCRSAYRFRWRPANRGVVLGFRLLRLPACCTVVDR